MTTADSLTRAVGNPKANSMQYYSAHRKTEHCKYMSRKTIAFWAMILGLVATVAFFADEPRFTQNQVFFRVCSLQNEVVDPPCFYISDMTNSSSFNGKIFRKKSILENFFANVLNLGTPHYPRIQSSSESNLPLSNILQRYVTHTLRLGN